MSLPSRPPGALSLWQPWAPCTNTVDSFECPCDKVTYGTCRDDYPCDSTLAASESLQVSSEEEGASVHAVASGDTLNTNYKTAALLQFSGLPPVRFIGGATLLLRKEPSSWPCAQQKVAAVHADFLSGVPGAGIRRFQPFDPPAEASIPVPPAPSGADLAIDVTSVLREAADSVSLLLSDPNNCRSSFASSHHPDATRRPSLHIEWASIGDCEIAQVLPPCLPPPPPLHPSLHIVMLLPVMMMMMFLLMESCAPLLLASALHLCGTGQRRERLTLLVPTFPVPSRSPLSFPHLFAFAFH